jgi:diguanylate cyclase (GGDEF)-like protein
MVGLVRRWWQQRDHFDWMTLYLSGRGMLLLWRVLIAGVCVVLAALPLALLASSTQPRSAAAVIASPLLAVVGVVFALFWLARWPTRRQSVVFAVLSNLCVAAACLVQADPRAGLLGCTAFAILGGYIAFFHTAGYMVFNFAIANITTLILSARLAQLEDIVVAVCAFTLIHMLNLSFPFAVQSLVHALGMDVRRSNLDVLTGVLNRRAFYQAAHALVARRPDIDTYLGVAMIDLDQFKNLNDTLGHPTGDQALIAVGNALRANSRSTCVIGRTGGEEFVVADICTDQDLSGMAERLRQAIAATPYPITASIGTACAPLGEDSRVFERRLIDQLVKKADAAMYEAKRAGGNQTRSVSVPGAEQN